MNNYIEQIIQTYYLNEKEKHDMFNGRGTCSYIDDINISFENINIKSSIKSGGFSFLYKKLCVSLQYD